MTDPFPAESDPWRVWFLRTALVGLLATLAMGSITSAVGVTSVVLSDAALYEKSMAHLFAGQIPYIDFPLEHMPLSALPMALAYVLSHSLRINYVPVFSLFSLAMLFVSGEIVSRIGHRIGMDRAGVNWVWLVGPMLPLVIFRVDPLAVLLAAAGALLMIQGRPNASFASTAAGILAKGASG